MALVGSFVDLERVILALHAAGALMEPFAVTIETFFDVVLVDNQVIILSQLLGLLPGLYLENKQLEVVLVTSVPELGMPKLVQ